MRTLRLILAVVLVVSGFVAQPGIEAVDTTDTKLLTQPAISASHIAFIYAGDLYSADLNGGNVRRLTSDEGEEVNPVFSPDGSTIAFSAQYDGNLDVFTVPVTGGAPTRLTWHPRPDVAQGFTPDGKAVLFASTRAASTPGMCSCIPCPLGRRRGAAADPDRGPGHVFAGWRTHRLQPAHAGVPAVEAVSRRHGRADLAVHREGPR